MKKRFNDVVLLSMTAFLAAASLTAAPALADCRGFYQERIKRLDGMMNPARTTLPANLTAAAAVPLTLLATGATIAPGAIVAMPAVALGAGVYLAVIEAFKVSDQKALRVIDSAIAQNTRDRQTQRLLRSLHSRSPGLTLDGLQKRIADANNSNEFCQVSPETGKMKLLGYHRLAQHLGADLAAHE